MRLCKQLLIGCGIAFSLTCGGPASGRNVVVLYDERVELPGLSLFDTEFQRAVRVTGCDTIGARRRSSALFIGRGAPIISKCGPDPCTTTKAE